MAKARPVDGRFYPATSDDGRNRRLHRVLAERALGRPIPASAPVHHFNEDIADVSGGNLVLCQDAAYHKLLHRRQEALAACGHASWRKCIHCKRHDDPSNLSVAVIQRGRGRTIERCYHKNCAAQYMRDRYSRRDVV